MKEEYLACLVLDGDDNIRFGTINIYLENKMMCGSNRYVNTNNETVEYSTITM